jgi:hypothetical protein
MSGPYLASAISDVDKAGLPNIASGDKTCWIATAANMLAGVGYGTGATIQARAESIYTTFQTQYGTTNGGWTDVGLTWWLDNAAPSPNTNPYQTVTVEGNKTKLPWQNANGAKIIGNKMRSQNMVGLSISWPRCGNSQGGGGHALTAWGDDGANNTTALTANPTQIITVDSDRDPALPVEDIHTYDYDNYNSPNPGGCTNGTGGKGWYFNRDNNHPFIKHIVTLSPNDIGTGSGSSRTIVGSQSIVVQPYSPYAAHYIRFTVKAQKTILKYKVSMDWTTSNAPVITEQAIANIAGVAQLDVAWNVSDNTILYDANNPQEITITTELVVQGSSTLVYENLMIEYPSYSASLPPQDTSMETPDDTDQNTQDNDSNITGGYVITSYELHGTMTTNSVDPSSTLLNQEMHLSTIYNQTPYSWQKDPTFHKLAISLSNILNDPPAQWGVSTSYPFQFSPQYTIKNLKIGHSYSQLRSVDETCLTYRDFGVGGDIQTSHCNSAISDLLELTSFTNWLTTPENSAITYGVENAYTLELNGVGNPEPIWAELSVYPASEDYPLDADGNESLGAICFPKGTPVTTDQGDIAIETINPNKHTIRGKKIVALTQATPLQKHIICLEKDSLGKNVPSRQTLCSKEHKIFYQRKMVKARNLVDICEKVTKVPYHGEILYNILLEKYDKMMVNNLICETLHPENIIAKISTMTDSSEKSRANQELSKIMLRNENSMVRYNQLYASLK